MAIASLAEFGTYRLFRGREFQVDWHRHFAAPELTASTDLETIRRAMASRVRALIQPHAPQLNQRLLHRTIARVVKHTLGVPRGETASNGSVWDTVRYHVLLTNPGIQRRLIGAALAEFIASGACPDLAAALEITHRPTHR